MFNILPDTFKASIIKEYHKRRLVVWLCAVCVLQISFLIFLMPSYIYLVFKEKGLEADQMQTASVQSQTASTSSIALIQNTQKTLSTLARDLPHGSVHEVLAELVSLKGSSITFKEISTSMQTATISGVTVQGIATTREALLALTERLQSDSMFSNIVLPVSSFAKDSNISFSLTMNAAL